MKGKYAVWVAVLLAMFLVSCNEEGYEAGGASRGEGNTVQFNSVIYGALQTKVTDQAWEAGDEVGIYMCRAGGEGLSANKKYVADAQGGLTPDGGVHLVYPEDGNVRFYAYYPYREGSVDYIYRVNAAEGCDLVWAVTDEMEASERPVMLLFEHQLAKIELLVKAGEGVGSLDGLSVKMQGMYGTADFDLRTGILSNEAAGGEAGIEMRALGNDRAGSVIVIPCRNLPDAAMIFSLNGASFKWDLSALSFNSKTKYVYTITLTKPAGGGVIASFSGATVADWTDKVVRDETLTESGEPAVPGARFGQPVLNSGVLKAGMPVSGVTITIPYTNGEGVVLASAGAEVSGVAAGGIEVAGQTDVALEAAGEIVLPVGGTPATAGEVVFTVKVDGKTIGMALNSAVEAGEGGGDEGAVVLEQDFSACAAGPAYPSSANTEFDVSDLGAGWSAVKAYSAAGVIKLGSGSGKGSLTTPQLGVSGTKDVRVSFDIAGWPNKNAQVVIVVEGGGVPSVELVEGYKNDGSAGLETRTFDVTGATASTRIKFEAKNAGNNQFFLDNLKISEL